MWNEASSPHDLALFEGTAMRGLHYFSTSVLDPYASSLKVPNKKRPPMECTNAGRPWSEVDLDNLRSELKRGAPLAEIAELLGRDVQQIQVKVEQLAAEHQYDPAQAPRNRGHH
jgi:hypothetical protein